MLKVIFSTYFNIVAYIHSISYDNLLDYIFIPYFALFIMPIGFIILIVVIIWQIQCNIGKKEIYAFSRQTLLCAHFISCLIFISDMPFILQPLFVFLSIRCMKNLSDFTYAEVYKMEINGITTYSNRLKERQRRKFILMTEEEKLQYLANCHDAPVIVPYRAIIKYHIICYSICVFLIFFGSWLISLLIWP